MNVKSIGVAATISLAATAALAAARAESVVKVELEDPSVGTAVGHMEITADRTSVAAGEVRFDSANRSKSLVHEMLVVKTAIAPQALPRDPRRHDVAESRIDSLGEVSELKPGASGALTVDLKPGEYLLICNQPGHVDAGMATRLTVTPRPS